MVYNKFTKLIGDYGEDLTAFKFLKENYEVYQNKEPNDIDLIIMKDNKNYSIQVKTATLSSNNNYCFKIRSRVSKKFYECDFFVFVGLNRDDLRYNKIWVVPTSDINEKKASVIFIDNTNKNVYTKYLNNFKLKRNLELNRYLDD